MSGQPELFPAYSEGFSLVLEDVPDPATKWQAEIDRREGEARDKANQLSLEVEV